MSEYFLGTMSSRRSAPIDETQYAALKQASHGVWTTLIIEERFATFAENHRELDAECARLADGERTNPAFAHFPVHETVQLLNRRLGNVLASAHGFTEQIRKSARKVFGQSELDSMEAFMSARYDTSLAYRFACALRNYAQHAGLPVSEVGFKYERLDSEEKGVFFRYTIDLDMVRRSPDPMKAAVMNELSQHGQRFELTPLVAEYVLDLHAVLREFRRLTGALTRTWIDQLVSASNDHDARHAFAFSESQQVERVSLLTSGIERLNHLRKHLQCDSPQDGQTATRPPFLRFKLTTDNIEKRRTPIKLRAFVEAVHERVRADPAERHKGLLKSKDGPYKQFLEEVVPLTHFAELAYPTDYRIMPIIGNQDYDARVFDAAGNEIECVEITNPHFGEEDGADARLVVARGFGATRVFEPGADLSALQDKIVETCRKKASRNYTGTTLVVAIDFMPPFSSEESWLEPAIEEILATLSNIRFQAKRVFLLAMPISRLIPIHTLPA